MLSATQCALPPGTAWTVICEDGFREYLAISWHKKPVPDYVKERVPEAFGLPSKAAELAEEDTADGELAPGGEGGLAGSPSEPVEPPFPPIPPELPFENGQSSVFAQGPNPLLTSLPNPGEFETVSIPDFQVTPLPEPPPPAALTVTQAVAPSAPAEGALPDLSFGPPFLASSAGDKRVPLAAKPGNETPPEARKNPAEGQAKPTTVSPPPVASPAALVGTKPASTNLTEPRVATKTDAAQQSPVLPDTATHSKAKSESGPGSGGSRKEPMPNSAAKSDGQASKPVQPATPSKPDAKPVAKPKEAVAAAPQQPAQKSKPSSDDAIAAAVAALPYAVPVPGRPGHVLSPFAQSHQLVDVAGIPVGEAVRCPFSGRFFRVPAGVTQLDSGTPAAAAAGGGSSPAVNE